MKGLDPKDAKGTFYSYKIAFIDGSLCSGKTAFLNCLKEKVTNVKPIVHAFSPKEDFERLIEEPQRWMFSILLNEMVLACKHLLDELKTPKNRPYILIEKSIFHFLTIGELEFEKGNMDRMEIAMLREECKLLYETIRNFLSAVVLHNVDNDKCKQRRAVKKLPELFDRTIDKYWKTYDKVMPSGIARFRFVPKDDLSDVGSCFKSLAEQIRRA